MLSEIQKRFLIKSLLLGTDMKGTRESPWHQFKLLGKEMTSSLQARHFGPDLISGMTVAAVALPLNLALAIASGLPPATGLIAGAIGGIVASLLGGSNLQITGPAAALSTLVFGIVAQYGVAGAAAAALLAGLTQIVLFLLGTGKLIHKVPEVVLGGFTTGVGLKILSTQIPVALGLSILPPEFFSRLSDSAVLQEISWLSFLCSLLLAFFLIVFKRFPKFPAAILGLLLVTFVSVKLAWDVKRVGHITLTSFGFQMPQVEGTQWLGLLWAAIPLGILAGAESLISASSVDRIVKRKPHHSNLELFGQGVANITVGLTGGMPVSGVIVRSSVNAYSGAKTRMSGVFHGLILIAATVFFGYELQHVPLPALAGILCVIGFRLVDFELFVSTLKKTPFDIVPFSLSMVGALTGHISAGLVLALCVSILHYLFVKRRKAITLPGTSPDIRARVQHSVSNKAMVKRANWQLQEQEWLNNLNQPPKIAETAFVHPAAAIVGYVVVQNHVHVAADTSIRADEGAPFYIGANTNVQDGVVMHALKNKWVEVNEEKWAIYIGERCSIAHQALVHGPTYIGDDCFVGFKAVVHDAIVGSGCYIGISAVVVSVELAERRFVPHGAIIDTQEKANALEEVSDKHTTFNADVVDVNVGLVTAYQNAYRLGAHIEA